MAYWLSLLLHPYNNCRTCKGRGQHRGAVFSWGRRPCHACSGTGTKQRLGAAVIGRGRPRVAQSRVAPPTRQFGKRR